MKLQTPTVMSSPAFGRMSSEDIVQWQNAIQGIEAGQAKLSSEEWSAFQALKKLAENGDFESSEGSKNIKIIKDALPSHSEHRLLQKVYLPNFISLCEMYFEGIFMPFVQNSIPSFPLPSCPSPSPCFYPRNSNALHDLKKHTLIHSIKGYLLFICPNIMTIKKIYKVSVSVGHKKKMFDKLISFCRENNMLFDNFHKIQIGEAMRLSLKGNTFEIKPINNEGQITRDDSTTDWSWNVKPLKKGKQHLTLVAAIIPTNSPIVETFFDLPVFEKIIEVEIQRKELIKDFFVENWKWLLGILLGSGLIWKIIDYIIK